MGLSFQRKIFGQFGIPRSVPLYAFLPEWWKNHSAICFFTLFPCFLMKYAVGLEIGNGTVLLTNAQCHDGTHISRPAYLVYWQYVSFCAKRALSACFSKKAESARYIILCSCSQSCPYRLQLAGRALTRAKGDPLPRARTPPAKRYEEL